MTSFERYPLVFRLANECEHLGRVIDRLDCWCPRKWVRQCALHGSTTLDHCAGSCVDYLPDDPDLVAKGQLPTLP